ncbi:hypothetical protein Hanom_Chr16g01484351 [Helianthus anomalus]
MIQVVYEILVVYVVVICLVLIFVRFRGLGFVVFIEMLFLVIGSCVLNPYRGSYDSFVCLGLSEYHLHDICVSCYLLLCVFLNTFLCVCLSLIMFV